MAIIINPENINEFQISTNAFGSSILKVPLQRGGKPLLGTGSEAQDFLW